MGFRFRKSIKVAPGVRLNFGKRGMSVSAGVRGARVTFGPNGTRGTVGLPGTGLSYSTRLDRQHFDRQAAQVPRRAEREQIQRQRETERLLAQQQRQQALSQVSLSLGENGEINATDRNGQALSPADIKLMWQQQGDQIQAWLAQQMEAINREARLIADIHCDTPDPDSQPSLPPEPFTASKPGRPIEETFRLPKPLPPALPSLGFVARLFKSRRLAHEERCQALEQNYQEELAQWQAQKQAHEQAQADLLAAWQRRLQAWETAREKHHQLQVAQAARHRQQVREDIGTMEQSLERALADLAWPRETLIDYEILDQGATVWLDVDLPEIEDLPVQSATLAANARKLNIKDKSQTQLRQEYARHIHGVAIRLAGTVFARLPAATKVVLSGYSQRLNTATGVVDDEYLYSVAIDRSRFAQLNFAALDQIDPAQALGLFDLRRRMTKTGVFKPVEPFSPQGN